MKRALAAMAVLLLTLPGVASAQGAQDGWKFGVAFPVMIASVTGNVTARGVTQDVAISFDQLKNKLDASLTFGVDARKGKFGLFTGASYMSFGVNGPTPGAVITNLSLKLVIVDAGASYRLYMQQSAHPFILEGTAGVRYWHVETGLTATATGGADVSTPGHSRYLVDPMIGLRGSQIVTPKLHVDFSGDVGGFNVSSHQSKLDWSAAAMLTYDATKWFSISGGYKGLHLEKSVTARGPGQLPAGDPAESGYSLTMHGPMIMARFRF